MPEGLPIVIYTHKHIYTQRVYFAGEICGKSMNVCNRVVQLEAMLARSWSGRQMLFYRKQIELNHVQVSLCDVQRTCKRAKKRE